MTIFVPYFPLVVAVLGALVYALASAPKAGEVGRIMFFCGLFVWLFRFVKP